jgi:hypothetical protein
MEPPVGTKATCSQCGREIVFVGPYWDHQGDIKPRHIAIPVQEADQSKSAQPAWWQTLDPREREQIRHARAYAREFASAGAPGHGQFLLIAKLSELLDAALVQKSGGA